GLGGVGLVQRRPDAAVLLAGLALVLALGVVAVVEPGVLPGGVFVGPPLRVPAAEQAVGVLGVLEPLVDDRRGVGVADHVLLEVALVLEHVVDDRAQEDDVAAGPQRHVHVGQGAGAGEAGVDVDDLGALGLGLDHPLEGDRVALGHVGALDQDAVRVGQVTRVGGGAAAAERDPQTGDGGGV